jgi:hypothetical protein
VGRVVLVFARLSARSHEQFCVTDDKDLPSVPPLELSVPADYPAQSPMWIDRQWQYGR